MVTDAGKSALKQILTGVFLAIIGIGGWWNWQAISQWIKSHLGL